MASKKRAMVRDKGIGKQRQLGRRLSKSILTIHKELARAQAREDARAAKKRRVAELLEGRYGPQTESPALAGESQAE